MVKLSDKLGKKVPVVPGNKPAAYDERQLDIHAPTPNFNVGNKPKEMKTQGVKISVKEGFGNQFRAKNDSIDQPSKNAFQGNRSGK